MKRANMRNLGFAIAFVVVLVVFAGGVSLCFGQSHGGMMGRGMHGGGMHGSDIRHGDWHHIWMHGISWERDPAKMSLRERGEYIFERACVECHGKRGVGGVKNPNYENGTIPELNTMADTMGLFEKEHAQKVVEQLEAGKSLEALKDDPPFRMYSRFFAQYENVKGTIRDGSDAAPANPKGQDPVDMPDWGRTLSDRDLDALVVYLVSLYDWDEEEATASDEDDG